VAPMARKTASRTCLLFPPRSRHRPGRPVPVPEAVVH
jgi:hypothetical protein